MGSGAKLTDSSPNVFLPPVISAWGLGSVVENILPVPTPEAGMEIKHLPGEDTPCRELFSDYL